MREIHIGTTGITTPQNGFGALPIQRISKEEAVRLVRMAYEGGMTYFDTARAYSDSEEKLGCAFEGMWDKVILATKSQAKTPDALRADLETSLRMLKTDCIDIYQFHNAAQVYRPGDGTGMYECMEAFKKEGKIRHISLTAHKIGIAMEAAKSGLYATIQFPFSYLSGEKEQELVRTCRENGVGFIAMKGLAGGLIRRADAAMAFMNEHDNVVPIWGVQKESELRDWLSFMSKPAEMTPEIEAFIEKERTELMGSFCRGCGYCAPCTVGIQINACARMSLMVRRAPSADWLTPEWQAEMEKIDDCIECGLCKERCPYGLDIPNLLRENLADYRAIIAGEVRV